MISYRIFKVWRRDLVVWQKNLAFYLVLNFLEPIIYLFGLGYGLGSFLNEVQGMTYVAFLAPAIIIISVMNGVSFETTYGSYTRLKEQKTALGIAMTPISMGEVIGGEILWAATKAMLSATTIFIVLWFMDVLHSPWVLLMPVVMLVTAFFFSAMGMLMTSFSTSYDFFSYYYTLALSPMFVFSGTFFPIESLPKWGQVLAYLLPATYAVRVARNLFNGMFAWDDGAILLGMTVVGILITYWATRRLIRQILV